ncbi:MAG: 4'-phosphopantetheinyl transferase superfamily protein [Clostridiaceae bacterium]|jgi:4'-phosphopantetheinyl transferase|nr:4'-phosphopantetheinyl transferase superfamily protein [Clostridiaceae bacterium]
MIQVAAVSLVDPLDTRQFDKLIKTVSMEKRRRIYRFRMHEDAQRTLLGDILARYLVCKQHNVKNCELVFGTNAYGKPYLLNDTRIQFNISHSGKWVVCSLHHLPVGVDIEQIKPVDISIAERFFSKSEVQSLMNKCISEREAYFYELWTLKESYIKAVGKGLSIPLNSFAINIEQGGNINIYNINGSNRYFFRQYSIEKGYKMAVCSQKNEFSDSVEQFDVNQLYEEVLQL